MKLYVISSENIHIITKDKGVAYRYEELANVEGLEVEGRRYLIDLLDNGYSSLTVKASQVELIELRGYVIYYTSVDDSRAKFIYTNVQEAKGAFNTIVRGLKLTVKQVSTESS